MVGDAMRCEGFNAQVFDLWRRLLRKLSCRPLATGWAVRSPSILLAF